MELFYFIFVLTALTFFARCRQRRDAVFIGTTASTFRDATIRTASFRAVTTTIGRALSIQLRTANKKRNADYFVTSLCHSCYQR